MSGDEVAVYHSALLEDLFNFSSIAAKSKYIVLLHGIDRNRRMRISGYLDALRDIHGECTTSHTCDKGAKVLSR